MPRLVYGSFAGGLWLNESRDFAIPPDGLLVCENFEFLRSGGLIGRRGRLKLNSSALGGSVRALWRHYPRTGTKNTLAVIDVGATTEIWKADDSSGTFAAATGGTGLGDDTRWGFANWQAKQKTFIVNESDGLMSWDGTTIAAVTPGGDNEVDLGLLGPYITLHKSRLLASKTDELGHSIYASGSEDELTDETVWLATNHLPVNDPQGGIITGIASFFDLVVIFKQTSLFRFIGDVSGTGTNTSLALYSDVGCVAPDSIAVTPYGIIFVGRQGVFATDGVDPNPAKLSTPIEPLFVSRSSETGYPNAIGRWYPRKQQYVLKLDPTASEGYVLSRVEILAENANTGERTRVVWVWAKIPALPATAMAVWDSESDDGRLILGDSLGYVRTYDTGSDDDGIAIVATMQMASIPIDNTRDPRARTGRVRSVKLLHRADTVLDGELLYDGAAPGAGASFLIGSTTLEEKFYRAIIDDRELFGRFVSLWLQNTESSADFEVHLADMETRLLTRRQWRDDNEGVSDVAELEGFVTIADLNTEAVVTFATAQANTSYEIAFGLYPSDSTAGLTTVGIKPGTKTINGFTVQVGGWPGTGSSYRVSWLLSRAA